MNTLIFLTICVALAASAQFVPQFAARSQFTTINRPTPSPLISRTEVRDEAGQFALSYQVADGTVVNEQGSLRPNAEGDQVLVKQGSYSFITPEGIPIQLTYVADENGFRPEGTHLPVPVELEQARFV